MNYGISNLSIVPMRNEAADQSEMVNQVIFGEHFKVLEIRKKWSKIRLAHDSYEGWICNKQWIEIEEDIYKQLDKEVATITTDILDIITKTHHQPIVIGSILPSYKSGHALINNEMYQFDGLTTPGFIKKDKLVENYKKQDKDLRLLTYKILVETFNKKYSNLNNDQKLLFKEYINNLSNTTGFKSYVEKSIPSIIKELKSIKSKIKDKVTQIKLAETISLLSKTKIGKNVSDNHVSSIMMSYELIKELKVKI